MQKTAHPRAGRILAAALAALVLLAALMLALPLPAAAADVSVNYDGTGTLATLIAGEGSDGDTILVTLTADNIETGALTLGAGAGLDKNVKIITNGNTLTFTGPLSVTTRSFTIDTSGGGAVNIDITNAADGVAALEVSAGGNAAVNAVAISTTQGNGNVWGINALSNATAQVDSVSVDSAGDGTGVRAVGGAEVIIDGAVAVSTGIDYTGIGANGDGTIVQAGSVSATSTGGGTCYGVKATGRAEVIIAGAVDADGLGAVFGVQAIDADTSVQAGSVTANSQNKHAMGVGAETGAEVIVSGEVKATGNGESQGISASGASTSVQADSVTANSQGVLTPGVGATGVGAADGAKVAVEGSVSAVVLDARSAAFAFAVTGNGAGTTVQAGSAFANSPGGYTVGATATRSGEVEVKGAIVVLGKEANGIMAFGAGAVRAGSVTSAGGGVYILDRGDVTIEGALTAGGIFVQFQNDNNAPYNFAPAAGYQSGGYYVYDDSIIPAAENPALYAGYVVRVGTLPAGPPPAPEAGDDAPQVPPAPQTEDARVSPGDAAAPGAWLALAVCAALALCGAALYLRRRAAR